MTGEDDLIVGGQVRTGTIGLTSQDEVSTLMTRRYIVHAGKSVLIIQIFIDEVDSLFSTRSSGDHEVTGMMKAEFMT